MNFEHQKFEFEDPVFWQGKKWLYHSYGTSPYKFFIFREVIDMTDEEVKQVKGHMNYFTHTNGKIYFNVPRDEVYPFVDFNNNQKAKRLLSKEY